MTCLHISPYLVGRRSRAAADPRGAQGVWGQGGCWGLAPAGVVVYCISDKLLEISVAFTLSHR